MAKSRGVCALLIVIVASVTALAWLGNPIFGLVLVALALAPLVVAGRVDMCTRRLPNRLLGLASLPAGAAAVFASGSASVAAFESLLGVALTAGPLLAVHLINPSGMGFGDVKLGMVLGLLVSSADWRLGIVVLLIASLGSALWCLARSQQSIAFGPPLIGSLVVVLVVHRLGLPHLGSLPPLSDSFVEVRS